jgi:sulfur relay (sulfurtransferase) DsrC/TusE family protein
MIYKTLQRRTDNNNGQKKKGKQWSTKHYTDVQRNLSLSDKFWLVIYNLRKPFKYIIIPPVRGR